MLKSLEMLPTKVEVDEEEGLFDGPGARLRIVAEWLADKIIAEPGSPMMAIRVARADLPEEDGEGLEVGFYLKLACGPNEAFKWLEQLSVGQRAVACDLAEGERKLFNHTFNITVDWDR